MTNIRALLTASILFAAIGTAQAQTPPVAAPDPHHPVDAAAASPIAPAAGPAGMGGMMGMMMAPERIEGRIAFLKTELKITDAQLPQWTAFAEILRKNAKGMSEMREMMMQASALTSAPDRADHHVKMMTSGLEAAKVTATATRTLYVVLTDAQKKTADELLAPAMGRM